MNRLHVACAADGRYLPFCFTMLRSLLSGPDGSAVTVHYLATPDFSASYRHALVRLCRRFEASIEFHEVPDARVRGLPPMRHIERIVWYRLFLPELLPHLDRVLYLDADTLVVDSIRDLWATELEGQPLAAVPNVLDPAMRRTLMPKLGLAQNERYFNSGVLLMDLRQMRHSGCMNEVLTYARRNADRLVWGDQDALNAVLHRAYKPLHPRWNCMSSLFFFEHAADVFDRTVITEATARPGIVHFEGPDYVKPWNVLSTHPLRDAYLQQLQAAIWWLPRPLWLRAVQMIWYGLPQALRQRLLAMRDAIRSRILRLSERRLRAEARVPRPTPEADAATLRNDHPRLQELRRHYAAVDHPIARHSLWRPAYRSREIDLATFRGDNAYVWQFRNLRADLRRKYQRLLEHVAARDPRGLVTQLGEDGAFGCWTFDYDGFPTVSRDLLDSINEMYFLDRHCGLFERRGLRVLDIGAGYGRLAHRMLAAVPGVERYCCLDAVAESTFLSEFYLAYRRCLGRGEVVPLHEIDLRLRGQRFDLAVNVHSFSEMSYEAITGWLDLLVRLDVPRLFVVPNDGDCVMSYEVDGSRRAVAPALANAGYGLVASEPVLADAALRREVGIYDHFLLFERA